MFAENRIQNKSTVSRIRADDVRFTPESRRAGGVLLTTASCQQRTLDRVTLPLLLGALGGGFRRTGGLGEDIVDHGNRILHIQFQNGDFTGHAVKDHLIELMLLLEMAV